MANVTSITNRTHYSNTSELTSIKQPYFPYLVLTSDQHFSNYRNCKWTTDSNKPYQKLSLMLQPGRPSQLKPHTLPAWKSFHFCIIQTYTNRHFGTHKVVRWHICFYSCWHLCLRWQICEGHSCQWPTAAVRIKKQRHGLFNFDRLLTYCLIPFIHLPSLSLSLSLL